jgi:hypothetical protein
MKTRILVLAAVSLLSGCASNMYWGPALITYGSGDAETFASGDSRNAAEYDTERKKLRAQNSATDDLDEESQLEEIVPLGAQYKIGNP